MTRVSKGAWQAAAAYVIWGLFPIYFKWLHQVPAVQIVSHRVVWSFLMLGTVLAMSRSGRAGMAQALKNPRILGIYLGAALLIGVNWLLFVWAVNAGEIVQTSLGYFLNPLISVVLGLLFFRERLRPWQWAALGLAAIGVLYVARAYGSVPWISLALAVSFALYGLVKKLAPLNPFLGLTLETALLVAPAGACLFYGGQTGQGAFLHLSPVVDALLVGSGLLTAVPLLLFAAAAQTIPLALLGVLQYITPTLQFLLGVWVYREPFAHAQWVGFGIVWVALAVFVVEGRVTQGGRWGGLRAGGAEAGAPAVRVARPDRGVRVRRLCCSAGRGVMRQRPHRGRSGGTVRRGLYVLMAAEFISAFGDNAVLFTAITMMRAAHAAAWYVPVLQATFLAAFVVLAPWTGRFADRYPKPRVLMYANALKALGAATMFSQAGLAAAYGVVGVGAALYAPAKYGLIPELVDQDRLVKANGLIDGSTIVAIILGGYAGARVADYSTSAALALVGGCYALSAAITLALPAMAAAPRVRPPFLTMARGFFTAPRARFALVGTSFFWAAGAVLRLILVAWVPQVLHRPDSTSVARLTLFLSLGIVAGALAAARLVPWRHLRRARFAAFAMGALVVLLSRTGSWSQAALVLVAVGFAGGVFMAPINAVLQDFGHHGVGSGSAVALQGFFENGAMLLSVALYGLSVRAGASAAHALFAVGLGIMVITGVIALWLPKEPAPGVHRGGRGAH